MSCTQTIFKCKTFHFGSLKYLSSISFGFSHPDSIEDPLSDNSRISSIITVCTIVTGCVLLRHAGNCNRGDKCGYKHNLTYLQLPGLRKERIDISHPTGPVVLTIYPKHYICSICSLFIASTLLEGPQRVRRMAFPCNRSRNRSRNRSCNRLGVPKGKFSKI